MADTGVSVEAPPKAVVAPPPLAMPETVGSGEMITMPDGHVLDSSKFTGVGADYHQGKQTETITPTEHLQDTQANQAVSTQHETPTLSPEQTAAQEKAMAEVLKILGDAKGNKEVELPQQHATPTDEPLSQQYFPSLEKKETTSSGSKPLQIDTEKIRGVFAKIKATAGKILSVPGSIIKGIWHWITNDGGRTPTPPLQSPQAV